MKRSIEVIFKTGTKTSFKVIRVEEERAEEMCWEAGEEAIAVNYLTQKEMKKIGASPKTVVSFDWASKVHGVY